MSELLPLVISLTLLKDKKSIFQKKSHLLKFPKSKKLHKEKTMKATKMEIGTKPCQWKWN